MRRAKIILAAAAVSALATTVASATDYTWLNYAGGTYSWTTPSNWTPSGFPNAVGDRAIVEGAVTGSLNIALPSTVTVGDATFGSSTAGSAIDIGNNNSGGGSIYVDNGLASATWNTTGVSTNVITAPVILGGSPGFGTFTLNTAGPNNLSFLGGIISQMDNVGTANFIRTLRRQNGSYVTTTDGTITSGTLTLGTTSFGPIALAQAGATANGFTVITGEGTTTNGQDPLPAPPIRAITFVSGGTVIFNGAISNGGISGGRLNVGNNGATVGTNFVFNVPSTYTGSTALAKGTFYLNTENAFGTGQIVSNAVSQQFTVKFRSNDDARTISNPIQLQQNMIFTGDHSFTITGYVAQSNSRSLVNNLPANKTLRFTNFLTPNYADGDDNRNLTFDGTGVTQVDGPIYNHRSPYDPAALTGATPVILDDTFTTGNVVKRGPGTVFLNNLNRPNIGTATASLVGPGSTYRGFTLVSGGYLEFANPGAYGKIETPYTVTIPNFTGGSPAGVLSLNSTTNPGTSFVTISAGGAVGVATGSTTPEFLTKLGAGTLNSSGGLALAPNDAAVNIDFTTGTFANAKLVALSLGAIASGTTYTGTITPDLIQGYRLGGGGTLTISGVNKLTGTRSIRVTNGGAVQVNDSQNYSGATILRGDYITTNAVQANTDSGLNDFAVNPYAVRVNGTLVTNNIVNGSLGSGLGAGANTANRLLFQGGSLKYTGGDTSTDRLFTLHTTGGTIESSGSGAVNFTNTAAITLLDQGAATGTLNSGTGSIGRIGEFADTQNITPGMTVTAVNGLGTFIASGATVVGVNATQVSFSNAASVSVSGATITFGNQNRNLTLSGSNVGNNVISATLPDSTLGKLGIVKSGPGAWALTNGASTFTGGVRVDAGTLSVKRLVNQGTTTINGGTLRIGPGGPVGDTTSTSVFAEGQFSIAGGANPAGRLDIAKNGVIFDYTTASPLATITALITAGRNGGNWAGNGITSSSGSTTHGVGVAEASAIGSPATFLGQSTDNTAVLVRYTRLGDANLSGNVSIQDFALLASGFGQPGGWVRGDFNYDGTVNINDFALLAANFGQVASGDLPRGAAVPEPTMLGFGLAGGTLAMLRRRRKA